MRDHPDTSRLEALRLALSALRKEIWDFDFRYPLDVDPEAGPPESLHYYLYSEKLSWSEMVSDPSGVPRVRHRLYGEAYAPGYIAWWGLVHLGHFLRHTIVFRDAIPPSHHHSQNSQIARNPWRI